VGVRVPPFANVENESTGNLKACGAVLLKPDSQLSDPIVGANAPDTLELR